jgi:hypothetical protein
MTGRTLLKPINSISSLDKYFEIEHLYLERVDSQSILPFELCPLASELQGLFENDNLNIWAIVKNVSVAMHVWFNGEVLFFPYARSGGFFCEDEYWVDFYPFLSRDENGQYAMRLDHFAEEHFIPELSVFMGGHHQFGHFYFDVLPRLEILKKLPILSQAPVITATFRRWELDIVNTLFSEIRFRQIPENSNKLLHFAKLALPLKISVKRGYEFIRNNVSSIRYASRTENHNLPEKVYVTRSKVERTGRVTNAEEIDNFMRAENFFLCEGGRYSAREMMELIGSAKLVVSDPITPHLNFNAYSNSKAKLISLLPDWIISKPNIRMLKGGLAHLYPILDRSLLIGGGSRAQNLNHEIPCEFSIEEIKKAVRRMSL